MLLKCRNNQTHPIWHRSQGVRCPVCRRPGVAFKQTERRHGDRRAPHVERV